MCDLFSDFLNDRIERVPMSGIENNWIGYTNELVPEDVDSDSESDTEQREYVARELKNYHIDPQKEVVPALDDISDFGDDNEILQDVIDVPVAFRMYNFSSYFKKELPIDSYHAKIVSFIESNSVVIIQGPTGCGKTTQVPQYIVDDCFEKKTACNIIVTQPRRIAAINLSQRVCEERGWAIGTVCGYQVGLDRKIDENVILTYVTTEVLLQRLISQRNLNRYTHIIIDEIHERNKTLDFLLLIVRKYLFTNSPKVRIVLMSATMDKDLYAHYFRIIPRNGKPPILPPVFPIKKPDRYKIYTHYINDLQRIVSRMHVPEYDINKPVVTPQQYQICNDLINSFDNFNTNNEQDDPDNQTGGVLVFLPGLHEIEEMHKLLAPHGEKYEVIPIHSSLSGEHMAKMFQKPKPGIRKIVLSTNIAESSLTLPDVTYVIDFCLTKVMTVNPITKFSCLTLEWASHDNCVQRQGRVGRVSFGRVYRLVPRDFYENQMKHITVPEMQRAPLESIILYMKQMEMSDTPKNVLSLAISPPNLKDVQTCIWHLKEIGALLTFCRGRWSAADGDITFLGRIMGSLPIDIHLGKMIILGHMFGCLEEAIIMAAGATTRNLFVNSFNERLQSYRKKLLWSDGSGSDFIALLNLYNVWLKSKREHSISTKNELYAWCKKNFVNYRGLDEWEIIIREIKARLAKYNIKPTYGAQRVNLPFNERAVILKVIICGAFYPHYFVRSIDYGKVDAREAVKVLNGRDPCSTVYFTNMKLNQPGQIYVRQIKQLLQTSNAKIGFHEQSAKVFVEFTDNKIPQAITVNGQQFISTANDQISLQVYEAVRRRQLKIPFQLHILSDQKAWDFVRTTEARLKSSEDSTSDFSQSYSPLPSLAVQEMLVYVSHINHLSNFYCQNRTDDTTDHLNQKIFVALNASEVFLEAVNEKIVINDRIYAARFNADMKFYRCKVLHLMPGKPPNAQVLFIDYGNIQKVSVNKLYHLPKKAECLVAPLAMSCTLSEVQPLGAVNAREPWKPQLNDLFRKKSDRILLNARVYSVVNDVVHLEMFIPGGKVSFNEHIINLQEARKAEESYLSKMDNQRRQHVQLSGGSSCDASFTANSKLVRAYQDFEAPPNAELNEVINLKGPFSPLEMTVCGTVEATTKVKVSIDELSVNAVLLDEKPEDEHARLIVAGSVAQSSVSNQLRIGQTTVMPNIPGLPMLMALIFCPEMETKLTDNQERVAAILCGLGYNAETGRSNYPQHDMGMILDTDLTEDIILKVNELRLWMNCAIKLMNNIHDGLSYDDEFIKDQTMLKNKILQILYMKQNPVKRSYVKDLLTWHGANVPYNLLRIDQKNEIDYIWPLLTFAQLNKEKRHYIGVYENLDTLYRMAKNMIPTEPISCQLCESKQLYFMSDVQIHLLSEPHTLKMEMNNLKISI